MTYKLELELPSEVYEPLADAARRSGTTLEGLAVEWLAAVGRDAARDPIEPFIGAFPSEVPDWTDRHDEYLGQALRQELQDQSGTDGG